MPKYESYIQSPYSSQTKVINLVGKNKKVLEVGCATGYISKELKAKNCYVVGIEIDKESALIAKKYCCDNVIIDDVESLKKLPYNEKYFDYIIYDNVLEHLKNPLKVVRKLSKYLKDDGYIYISVPNVAHWLIRLKLLIGKFDYQEYGVMDITHLRFFTKKSAEKMILKAGFKICKFDVVPSGLYISFIQKSLFIQKFIYMISKMYASLLASQFIFIALKKIVT